MVSGSTRRSRAHHTRRLLHGEAMTGLNGPESARTDKHRSSNVKRSSTTRVVCPGGPAVYAMARFTGEKNTAVPSGKLRRRDLAFVL